MLPAITFKVPPELHAAISEAAENAGQSPGEWARALCAAKLGIKIELKRGMGGADEETRERVEKARYKGWEKAITKKRRTKRKDAK